MRHKQDRAKTKVDILITGARVCDGTGQPWFPANVSIKDGKITAVGVSIAPSAARRIDARGLMLSPGFIDVHTHADGILKHPSAENILSQGVTTVISGNCGGSGFPLGRHFRDVAKARPAINYATLVGHGTIRGKVMGMAARRPTRKELLEMCRLAETAMRAGALGISSGLFYVPGAWAVRAEITEICRVIAAWGGLYATHKRSAGGKVIEAITEAAEIGRRARIPVQISHLKVLHRRGRTDRRRMADVIAHIQRYREEGIDIGWDIHPYPATCTSLSAVVIPEWISADGKRDERLLDDSVRRRIYNEVAGKIAWIGGADKISLIGSEYDGRNLAQIACRRKMDPVYAAMSLAAESNPACIFHALRQADIDMALTSDLAMIASDGGVVAPGRGLIHPRNFGTFARVIGSYVRDRRLLKIEEAVCKMTFMPARKFGLVGRGKIAAGMIADITIFDPMRIGSRADFNDPRVFAEGVRWVLVNGGTAWAPRRADRGRWGEVVRGVRT